MSKSDREKDQFCLPKWFDKRRCSVPGRLKKKLQNTAGDDDGSSKAPAVRLANKGHCLLAAFMRLRPASGGRTPGPTTSFPQGFDSLLKIRSTFNANITCGLQWLQPSVSCSA